MVAVRTPDKDTVSGEGQGEGIDSLTVIGPRFGQSAVCAPILHALPEWFGIPEATAQYLEDIETRPTFLARANGEIMGFLTLTVNPPSAAEIHVMGVCPEWHRRGVGRALLRAAETYLAPQGVTYLQVKTLSARHPDEHYARTRDFYLAMGFQPLQEFPELWGPENPCLQLVKEVGGDFEEVSRQGDVSAGDTVKLPGSEKSSRKSSRPSAAAQRPKFVLRWKSRAWRIIHWLIILNFVVEALYGFYMVFFVIGGRRFPLFSQAMNTPVEVILKRRLYALETWLAMVGLAIYLAITELLPRFLFVWRHELMGEITSENDADL